MNYAKILKRAWDILWSYKTLWVFGIILALTAGGNFNGGPKSTSQVSNNWDNFHFDIPSDIKAGFEGLSRYFNQAFLPENRSTLIGIGIAIIVFFILLSIIFTIARYVSQTALIKMVDTYETSGEKVNWKQGFRLGWSRHAWQLFLINLTIFLPLFLIAMIFMGCAFIPVLLSMVNNNEPSVPGIIASVGLFFLIIFILVIVGIVLSLFMEIIYRECVLKGNGVRKSIQNGWKKVIRNAKDVILMWLILIGIRLGFFLITLPIIFLLLVVGIIVSGGVGIAVFFLINAMNNLASWVTAAIVGGSLFLIIFSLPLLFLKGLLETYLSSVWTLTYRELVEFELIQNALPPSTENGQTSEKEEIPSPL